MHVGSPAGVVDGSPAAPFQRFQIVGNRIRDGEGTGAGIVPFLPSQFGAPPVTRSLLRLPVVKDGVAIGVLGIVGGPEPHLSITAILRVPACNPSAAVRKASIAEMEADFESPEMGLGSNWQASPRRPRFEFRVANQAGHTNPPT